MTEVLSGVLATDAQFLDQVLIARFFFALQVVQQLTALSNHLQKATTTVVVLLVGFEVLGERVDARGQDCDLDFRRTGVTFSSLVFADDLRFAFYI